jgi:hypothetical protein
LTSVQFLVKLEGRTRRHRFKSPFEISSMGGPPRVTAPSRPFAASRMYIRLLRIHSI